VNAGESNALMWIVFQSPLAVERAVELAGGCVGFPISSTRAFSFVRNPSAASKISSSTPDASSTISSRCSAWWPWNRSGLSVE
jgi:hypothetical protein